MPRQPRLDLPGIVQHVVQRGNDRQPCFFADIDRARYLQDLRELALARACQVHAYVLMTNHVHLLVTPRQSGAVAVLMQALGRRYVRYVNDHYRRTGTLWEGRYKACLVDGDDYLLRCYRYIELNPVRAGMVADPAEYPWSSHRANAFGVPDPLVRPHERYRALGDNDDARRTAYRALVVAGLAPAEVEHIRATLQRQHALGSDRFRDAIERQLGRRAGPAKIGRPPKLKASEESAL
ncbi:MAG: transposase [Pseudoxanthomonas sp.]|nr:transposase [Pseudoxanthomonas sp.]